MKTPYATNHRALGSCCVASVIALAVAMVAPGLCLAARSAAEILEASGVKGGLVVHVGCGDGRLTAALRASDAYVVHGLDADAANVERARAHIASLGLYGPVSVDTFDGARLPYVDNLVNLLVSEDLGAVKMEEVLRVLAPLGVAYVKSGGQWTKTVKPWPAEIDEWRQYLHGADNNAVARDKVVGPPRHTQWTSGPSWSRAHMTIPSVSSMVSSRGRLFFIVDTATPAEPFLPGKFALVARDAFNGIDLWTHAFPDWEPITRFTKQMAVQLQRRLAAIGDVVYCTPGLEAPVTAFDAATGKILTTYEGTERTQEFAYDQGALYLVIGDRMNAAVYNITKTEDGKGINLGGSDPLAPFLGTGFRGAYGHETPDIPDPVCAIVAVAADSGKELWRTKDIHGYIACTLAIRGAHAVYQTSGGLVCLERQTGAKKWGVEKTIESGDGTAPNALVLSDDAVYAQEGKRLCVYALADGAIEWEGPISRGSHKPGDLFLTGGVVWTGGIGEPTSFDPATGKKLSVLTQIMTGPMSHDRCYRSFITERFYINSKTGGADFLALDQGKEFPNYWTRGGCGFGVLPCNGLLYNLPFSCQCSIGQMVKDMNALRTEKGLASSGQDIPVERKVRLIKGPAYGLPLETRSLKAETHPSDDWPTYRGDMRRSGSTRSQVPTELKPRWEVKLTTLPSPPVVAEGKVFVADVQAHTLHALDAADGREVWRYVAGGRIDTPPTIHRGLVLFGSRDGWVHCIRASDGALVWRFKDLPDQMICAFRQLESAWPVCGSVLVAPAAGTERAIAYFAAGRSSFLDGGIFLYGLDAETGEIVHSRRVYGPFDEKTGFPETVKGVSTAGKGPFKSDIFVTDGSLLYLRHRAFKLDLSDAGESRPHLIPSAGFLDPVPQHRTYWTIGANYSVSLDERPSGDILAMDDKCFYEVRGFPVRRYSYFDPRVSGYKLFAGSLTTVEDGGKAARRGETPAQGQTDAESEVDAESATVATNATDPTNATDKKGGTAAKSSTSGKGKKGAKGKKAAEAAAVAEENLTLEPIATPVGKWSADIPLTGEAMALAGDVVFVAGVPALFPPDNPVQSYEAAYEGNRGGVLWAASAADGKKLAEIKLDSPPTWDGMAAGKGRLYLATKDGKVMCFAAGQ